MSTVGPPSLIFFVGVIFFGSFYLLNLMLAVVAQSYEAEAQSSQLVSLAFYSKNKSEKYKLFRHAIFSETAEQTPKTDPPSDPLNIQFRRPNEIKLTRHDIVVPRSEP